MRHSCWVGDLAALGYAAGRRSPRCAHLTKVAPGGCSTALRRWRRCEQRRGPAPADTPVPRAQSKGSRYHHVRASLGGRALALPESERAPLALRYGARNQERQRDEHQWGGRLCRQEPPTPEEPTEK